MQFVETPPVAKVNILLVDDCAESLLVLGTVLADLGQNLVRAASGRAALEHLREQDFAAILLDVEMPQLDGFETARLIRGMERAFHTPILFLTDHCGSEARVAQGYALGAVDYLCKPVDPVAVRAKVQTFVRLAQQAGELRRAELEVRRLNEELERRVRERTTDLQQAHQRTTGILESITDCFYAVDREWRFTAVNPQAEAYLHRSAEELLGNCVWELFPQAVGTIVEQEYRRALAEGVPIHFETRTSTPEIGRWAEVHVHPAPDGLSIFFRDISDRKRTEQRLREREEQLDLVTNSLPVLVAYVDAGQCYRFNNRTFETWFGRSAVEIQGKHLREVLGEVAYEQVRPHVEAALSGRRLSVEQVVPYRSGGSRFVRIEYVPHVGAGGAVEGYIALIEDISDRKRVEEQLRDETRTVETIQRVGAALAGELDLEKLVQALTDAGTELTTAQFGAFFYNTVDEQGEAYTLYTLSGVPREAFAQFPMPRNTAVFGPTFRSEGSLRLDDVTQDPRYGRNAPYQGMPEGHLPVRSYLAVPVSARSGEVLGGLFFGHAEPGVFTERHERILLGIAAQAAVAIDNARLYQGLANATEGLRYTMEHARCLLWHATTNAPSTPGGRYRWKVRLFDEEAAQRFLPLELLPGESYMQAFYRCKPPEDRKYVDDNARAAFEAGSSYYRQEHRCKRADGQLRWLSEETHLEQVEPGRWRAVGVCTDITELKQLEAELQARVNDLAEADQRKDEFLSMLAHELRNPVGAVSNALHIMTRAPQDSAHFQRARESAVRQVAHQTRLISDLLDVSRITRGKLEIRPELLDLSQLVRVTVEDYRSGLDQAGVSLYTDLPPISVPIRGDRTRLAQVLGNLLDNAGKFTPAGGTVTVRLVLRNFGQDAVVSVIDTGVGIRTELLTRVFDPFIQADQSLDRSRGGLGLGLALVKGLVELHGGEVAAHSAGLERGTELTFRLPVAREPAVFRTTSRPPRSTENPLRILVVEDNPDAAETLLDLLELWGHEVTLASTGPRGVEVARQLRPQVILCDIGLPGMDGYQVATELRSDPSVCVARLIAVTGYGGNEDRRRSLEVGFEAHLTKPVDPDELQQLLAAHRE